MPKVYSADGREFLGKRCWLEIVGNKIIPDGEGGNICDPNHILAEVEVEFMPLKRNPSILCSGKGYGAYVPMDRYGDMYVLWDGRPTEPYFKDGWPEWEIIE